jgi:exopolysaccharide production protein ExoQ
MTQGTVRPGTGSGGLYRNEHHAGAPTQGRLWTTQTQAAVFMFLAIALGTNGVFFFFASTDRPNPGDLPSATGGNSPAYVALWLGLWLWTGIYQVLRVYRQGLDWSLTFVAPVVVLILLSSLWSVSAPTTLYFGAMVTANILVAHAMATMGHPQLFLRILTWTLVLSLAMSFVLLAINPEIAAGTRYGGGWLTGIEFNGVFAHKSSAGYHFGLLLIALILSFSHDRRPALKLAIAAVTVLALIMTNSATGFAGAIIISLAFLAERLLRLKNPAIIYVVAASCVLIAAAGPFIDIGGIAGLVGRDPGLTGRSQIWPAGIAALLERPILGHGYYGFFYPGDFSPVWKVWNADQYFKTPHFHNSVLDIGVSLGVVGLTVYAYTLWVAFAVLQNKTLTVATRQNLAAALTMMVLSSAFDFTIMFHNSFATIITFYCFFASQTAYTSPGGRPHGSNGPALPAGAGRPPVRHSRLGP